MYGRILLRYELCTSLLEHLRMLCSGKLYRLVGMTFPSTVCSEVEKNKLLSTIDIALHPHIPRKTMPSKKLIKSRLAFVVSILFKIEEQKEIQRRECERRKKVKERVKSSGMTGFDHSMPNPIIQGQYLTLPIPFRSELHFGF